MVFIGFVLSVLFRRPMLNPEYDATTGSKAWLIKPIAWLSLVIWIAVVFSGRWIAYT